MGLLWRIIEDILNSEDKDKKREEKMFREEAEALGMDEWEMEDAKKSGLTPDEWVEENEPEDCNNS